MKKIVSIIMAAAFCLSLIPAVFADEVTLPPDVFEPEAAAVNLALSGNIIVDSVNEIYGGEAQLANDGDHTTRWQSNSTGASEEEAAWIGVDLLEEYKLGKLVIEWEVAHPSASGVRVEISDDGENWIETPFILGRTGTENDDHQVDTIVPTEHPETRFVRVVCFKSYYSQNVGLFKDIPSAYEFEVYEFSEDEDYENIESDEIPEDPVVEPVEPVEPVVTPVDDGNLAPFGKVIVDSVSETEYLGSGDDIRYFIGEYAVDGDSSLWWTSGAAGTEDDPAWIGVDLLEEYKLGKLIVEWRYLPPTKDGFRIEISDDGENWIETPHKFKRTQTESAYGNIDTIVLTDAPVTRFVRIVRFKSVDAPSEGPERKENVSVTEFKVYEYSEDEDYELGEDEVPDDPVSTPGDIPYDPEDPFELPDAGTPGQQSGNGSGSNGTQWSAEYDQSTGGGVILPNDMFDGDDVVYDAPDDTEDDARDDAVEPGGEPVAIGEEPGGITDGTEAGQGLDANEVPHDGVESYMLWAAILAVATLAAVFTAKKLRT